MITGRNGAGPDPVTAAAQALGTRQRRADGGAQAGGQAGASSRALVPVTRPKPAGERRTGPAPLRGSCGFVTQLIASSLNLEGVRLRRRAAPDFAAAAYLAAAARPQEQRPQRRLRSL